MHFVVKPVLHCRGSNEQPWLRNLVFSSKHFFIFGVMETSVQIVPRFQCTLQLWSLPFSQNTGGRHHHHYIFIEMLTKRNSKCKRKGQDTCYSATYSALQSRKWQLTGMSQWYRSALCGHPLPALTDNWTHGTIRYDTIRYDTTVCI